MEMHSYYTLDYVVPSAQTPPPQKIASVNHDDFT